MALTSFIVPEAVDQLYQKSIEPKPTPKDAPKPKAPGKPIKKEHPAFDVNPKIAKGYLERLQAGKEFETGHLGRPIYEEEENHAAVHFAPAQEQYSQWKDIEEYEEKVEVPSDRAETWADKLRRKQNIANGIIEEQTPKGSRGQSLLYDLRLTQNFVQDLSNQDWYPRQDLIHRRGRSKRMHQRYLPQRCQVLYVH